MRVLLDCRMASWSGIGRYATGLARSLAEIADVDIVQVHSRAEPPPVTPGDGVEATDASAHPFGVAGALELGRIAARVRPDLTHCLHFPTPLPARHPLVVSLHDLTPLVVPEAMPSALKRAVYRAWNARAVGVADRLLANSEHTSADIARLFPDAAEKLSVVLHTAGDFADGPVSAPPADVVAPGTEFLLSMGNTKAHKDLPTLVRAFARIAPAHPNLVLLLVGADEPGFVRSVLGADAAAPRVRFTGRIDDTVLRALYRGAAAFVFPSRYEGFGLPPLEAMAFGTPCIVADATSLPEVVADAALLFAPGNSDALAAGIEQLLNDPVICEHLRQAGLRRVRELSWKHTAEKTVAVYAEVLGGK